LDVLGLTFTETQNSSEHLEQVMNMVLELRAQVRAEKNWSLADSIRDGLANAGIEVKDGKDGANWELR
jgi:cysteinyl-tRNA synthetase